MGRGQDHFLPRVDADLAAHHPLHPLDELLRDPSHPCETLQVAGAVRSSQAAEGLPQGLARGVRRQVDDGLTLLPIAALQLQHGPGEAGTLRAQPLQRGHHVLLVPQVLEAERHVHSGFAQDSTPRRLRAQRLELRVGGVERNVEQGGQAPLERGGAEYGHVGTRKVGDGGSYLLEEPRPLQDLLGEGPRRGIVDREQSHAGSGVAGGDAGQEVEVVVHHEGRDRQRGHVHDARLGIAKAHEQEQERLLVEASGAEAREVPVVHGHRRDDH